MYAPLVLDEKKKDNHYFNEYVSYYSSLICSNNFKK